MKEYAVTVAVCGTTNPASNCAQQTTSYYKGQTYNGCAANATALNVSSFTYHSYEIENVSYYEPLNTTESFLDSRTSQFSPLNTSSSKTASPTGKNLTAQTNQELNRHQSQIYHPKETCEF
jgi:hypothetical protein